MRVDKAPKDQSLSLKKAICILRCFTHDQPQRSLADIVEATEMPRTVCYRLLSTLLDEGLVYKESKTGLYYLSMALFSMGSTALGVNNIVTVASHYLSLLSGQTHDTALLIVEHNGTAMCIARVDGDFPIQQNALSVGKTWPLHVGGAPFCIFSYLPEERRESMLRHPLPSLTQRTVTDPEQIRERVEQVRSRGYSVGNEDALDYLVAIGAPVLGYDGKIIGAISVGGLSQRYSEARIEEVAKLACHAAAEISTKLGFRPDA